MSRFTAAAATVVALILGGVGAGSASAWAPASSATVHPGVQVFTDGAQCTANFVFTGGGKTYLGQAAHCSGTGEATDTNGCDAGSAPLGTDVTIHGSDGRDRVGNMVYSSWV